MPDMPDAVKYDGKMSSQRPTFRHTVAERMEAYRERMAQKIRAEMSKNGEDVLDLSHAIGVRDRTIERWLAKQTEPQHRNLKALAEHWNLKVSDIRPDLEEEERLLQQQLDRIEGKLDTILDRLPAEEATRSAGTSSKAVDRLADEVDALLPKDDEQAQREDDEPGTSQGAS